MERIKKPVYCRTLNKEIIATFYFDFLNDSVDHKKYKAVRFYRCDDRNKCGNKIVLDCSCLRELKRVEWEVNSKL